MMVNMVNCTYNNFDLNMKQYETCIIIFQQNHQGMLVMYLKRCCSHILDVHLFNSSFECHLRAGLSFRLENSQCLPCIKFPHDQSSLIWNWQSWNHGFHMLPFRFPRFFFTPGKGIGDGSFVMPQKFFVYLQFMVAVPSVGWAKESQFRQIDVEGQGLITLKQIELATSLNWALFLQLIIIELSQDSESSLRWAK